MKDLRLEERRRIRMLVSGQTFVVMNINLIRSVYLLSFVSATRMQSRPRRQRPVPIQARIIDKTPKVRINTKFIGCLNTACK